MTEVKTFQEDPYSCHGDVASRSGGGVIAKHDHGKKDSTFKWGKVENLPVESSRGYSTYPENGTYKEAVLRQKETLNSAHLSTSKKRNLSLWRNRAGRCFRCLASDHHVTDCRDPVRCLVCSGIGHRVAQCKKANLKGERTMNRGHQRRGRIPHMKAFMPYTEEYLRMKELRRNALLANVVQPADLGQTPQ